MKTGDERETDVGRAIYRQNLCNLQPTRAAHYRSLILP
jgi:hypothetical protein